MADDENREFLLRTKTRDASIDSLDSTKTINGTHDAIMNVIMLNEKKIKKNITLSLCVIFFYIIIGIITYHLLMGWSRLEALYFVVITLSTVGYGDRIPKTEGEKIFTCFYIIIGVIIFGNMIGTLFTFVKSHQDKMTKRRSIRALLKMQEQEERRRSESLTYGVNPLSNSISQSSRVTLSASVPSTLTTNSLTTPILTRSSSLSAPIGAGGGEDNRESGSAREGGFTGLIRRLTSINYDEDGEEEAELNRRSSKIFSMISNSFSYKPKTLEELKEVSLSVYEEDFIKLRNNSVIHISKIILLVFFSMLIIKNIENFSYSDSFYWCIITIMTVGYGDITINSTGGKWFAIIYIILACSSMARLITDFVKLPLLYQQIQNERIVLNQFQGELSLDMLERIFSHELFRLIPNLRRHNKEISKAEFTLLLLQLTNRIEEKDIILGAKLFENLDTETVGYLSHTEILKALDKARMNEIKFQSEIFSSSEPNHNTPHNSSSSSNSSTSSASYYFKKALQKLKLRKDSYDEDANERMRRNDSFLAKYRGNTNMKTIFEDDGSDIEVNKH